MTNRLVTYFGQTLRKTLIAAQIVEKYIYSLVLRNSCKLEYCLHLCLYGSMSLCSNHNKRWILHDFLYSLLRLFAIVVCRIKNVRFWRLPVVKKGTKMNSITHNAGTHPHTQYTLPVAQVHFDKSKLNLMPVDMKVIMLRFC